MYIFLSYNLITVFHFVVPLYILSRFNATFTGTYWYHSHLSYQRTMGAYGAFIVLERSLDGINSKRVSVSLK